MKAGDLRDRIAVQRQVPGDDGHGNVVTGWADLVIDDKPLKLWANVRETPGKERVEAGRLEASRTATIRVRASSLSRQITEADRVIVRGQVWNIRGIAALNDGRDMLEMTCESGVAT